MLKPTSRQVHRSGLTIVELLIVIMIIGLLIALLTPAVQAARERARRSTCQNHLRQLALGSQMHHDAQGFLPSGGWAGTFLADPSRGVGRKQPGGWLYGVLPFIEQLAVFQPSGARVQPTALDPRLKALYESSPAIFYCPSRRESKPYPFKRGGNGAWAVNVAPEVLDLAGVTKTDYAASSGDTLSSAADLFSHEQPMWFPKDYAELDADGPKWTETADPQTRHFQTGVMFYRSEITTAQVEDGASNTYLCGEKFLSPEYYADVNGTDNYDMMGDNQSAWAGYEWDNHRVAWNPKSDWSWEHYQPRQDSVGGGAAGIFAFGSAHPGSLNMAYCDGSVRDLSYDVDPTVHRQSANRLDGDEGQKPVEWKAP